MLTYIAQDLKILPDYSPTGKSKADLDSVIHNSHCCVIQMSHLFLEPFFVKSSNLLKQYYGITG